MMKLWKTLAVAFAAAAITVSVGMSVWAAEKKQSYTYTSGTVRFGVGDEWTRVHKELGKEKECKTLANCANGGRDKYYVYDDCDIYVTQNAKKQTVIDTVVLKGTAQTEEGVKLGQTPKNVMSIYPDAKAEYGLYTVEQGDSRIVIDCGIRDDKVVSISYEMKN